MRFVKGVAVASACLLSGLALATCGGGGGGGGGNDITGHTRSVISQRGWQLDVMEVLGVDLGITGTGTATVDATVEWTYGTNDVDLYVTNTSCTIEMFSAEACSYVAQADSSTAKPEKLSFSVSAAGNYRFWIVNFGPTRESGTLEVAMTQ